MQTRKEAVRCLLIVIKTVGKETMFKRLKQNFPLKYFLGDNQNAIEIQIWVSLIVQLIMVVIQRQAQRKWAYSNMVSVIRYHLMTYIDLFKFLKSPDDSWEKLTTKPPVLLVLIIPLTCSILWVNRIYSVNP